MDRRRSTTACLPQRRFAVAGRRFAATGAESPSRDDGLPPAAVDRRLSSLICLSRWRSVSRDGGSPSLYDGSPPLALNRRRSTTVCRSRRRFAVRGRRTVAAGDEAPSGGGGSPSMAANRCQGAVIRCAWRQSAVERRWESAGRRRNKKGGAMNAPPGRGVTNGVLRFGIGGSRKSGRLRLLGRGRLRGRLLGGAAAGSMGGVAVTDPGLGIDSHGLSSVW